MTQYGLIGWPLGHSFSAGYFNSRFAREGIEASYSLYPFEHIGEVTDLIKTHPLLKGLNVTAPHKRNIIPFLSCLTPQAQQAQAVNCIRIERSGNPLDFRLIGHNTDIGGFADSITPLIKSKSNRALILGTGGAAAAVKLALRSLGIESIMVSRKPANNSIIAYDSLDESIIHTHNIIVNATPLGTWPITNDAPPFPYRMLTSKHICHDLVYNPAVTKFMQLCNRQGAIVKNGLDMLYRQAQLSYDFWQNTIT